MLYIGVDLGTSAVKLLLMDEKGGIKKIVSKEYDLYFPHPGWSEQKPEDWYTQSMEGIKELISECDKSQVSGISFGGQMHGLVVLDENDNVIVDWTKMVYRWTDCPALTGLDLGTYTGLTMVDDLQGENQDIMKNTYIGRRAYYTDKTALESETYDALWNILTAGAVSTVGQQ